MKACRMELSEKGAKLVDRWSMKPLPSEYRKAIEFFLKYENVDGWTEYKNPNETSTIIIRKVSRGPPRERYFNILIRNNDGLEG